MVRNILKFLVIFIFSFILIESIEWILMDYFHYNFEYVTIGWLGFVIFYGFKFHIFCCLAPMIWAGYKCRHKSCEHEYCNHEKK